MTAAVVILAGAVLALTGALVTQLLVTRSDAQDNRDNIRKLGVAERDRDSNAALVTAREAELVTRKRSEAAAVALAKQLGETLKGVRHEVLDAASAADLLAAVDRLSRQASGDTAPAGGDGDSAGAGRVPIDPWAAEGTDGR